MDAVVARLESLDGVWEVTGRDRFPGVVPESLVCTYNDFGSDTASFVLKRQPGDIHPDLSAFGKVEIEVGGVKVWSGRLKEGPEREGSDFQVAVAAEGMQAHLDDDTFERMYAHTRMTEWTDTRQLPNTDLTAWKTSGSVENGEGVMTIGWAKNAQADANQHIGVTVDLGPYSTCKRVVIDTETIGPSTAFTFAVRGHDGDNPNPPSGQYEDAIVLGHESLTDTVRAGTFTKARRYLTILLFRDDGGSGLTTGDNLVKIKSVKAFSETAYESGNVSVLKASTIVRDVRARLLPLLANTDAKIEDSAFSIEDFVIERQSSARETLQAANAYEDRLLQISVDDELIYRARSTDAALEAGPNALFEDASAGSGEEIVNKALAEGTGPDGTRVVAERSAPQLSGVPRELVASPAFPNPSFATNTTGWTALAGTITRDTGTFDTTPASGFLDAAAVQTTIAGSFLRGVHYIIAFRAKASISGYRLHFFTTGVTPGAFIPWNTPAPTAFTDYELHYTPVADHTDLTIQTYFANAKYNTIDANSDGWIDSFQLYVSRPTLVDRHRFVRAKTLPIEAAVTTFTLSQLADTYLRSHMVTPFRGSLKAPAHDGLRRPSGDPVHPSQAGLYMGELVRLPGRIDPDTGAVGRDARVVGVSYSHADETADIQLDNRRGNFEALLARLALVTGPARTG